MSNDTDIRNTLEKNGNKAMRYYLIALVVLILDQITKTYFNTTFELHETVDVIPPVLNWTLAYNYGAAFSFGGRWRLAKVVFCHFRAGGVVLYHHLSTPNPQIR